jgi:hypothetical protein
LKRSKRILIDRINSSMKYILLLLLLTLGGCQTNNIKSGDFITQTVSLSSAPFLKAKYLTELTYITKDKVLVGEFKKCYIQRKCTDPKFKTLRKWAAGKDRGLVIESINLFLKADFKGI